jgi:putative transposase
MPQAKVMVHYVWSTKRRDPIIVPELKPLLLSHIKENSVAKGIFIDCMNCVCDHIHLLVSLGKEQTLSNVAKLIKGESSFWVNRQKIISQKFQWQEEYFVVSVSESGLDRVRKYIEDQEEHHRKMNFTGEYEALIKIHGFSRHSFG